MAERVIIIGSGPAGWSAAIYAARAELKPLVFEGAITEENRLTGTLPLGQLALTTEVENYAGFPAGDLQTFLETAIAPERLQYMNIHEGKHAVTGPELMELMRQQAINFGTRIVTDDVVEVDLQQRPFVVRTLEGELARGARADHRHGRRANYLGLPSEEAYKNRGVSACAVCDGALPRFRNKPLVVVGGGDSAVEEATYLTKYASKVHMVHRRDKLRASMIMQERALGNPKIQMEWNHTLDEVLGNDKEGVTGVRLGSTVGDGKTGNRRPAACSWRSATRPTRPVERPGRADRKGLHQVDEAVPHGDQRRRRVRGRRRGRRLLPPGDHLGRHRLHGGPRRRTLAGK